MDNFLENLEYRLFELALRVANAIGQHLNLSERTYISAIDRLFDARLFYGRYEAMAKEYHGPKDFDIALSSDDFTVRHVVANKIIMSYLVGEYDADDALLLKAAEVVLEDVPHTHADTSKLLSIWKAGRGKLSDEEHFLPEEQQLISSLMKNGKEN